ncbi:MAG: DUF6288 domain-containing protein [bacterium]
MYNALLSLWMLAVVAMFIMGGGTVDAFGAYGNPEPKATQHEYSWRLGPQCQLDYPSGGHWFNLGPTGARAKISIAEPKVFIVKYVFPVSPADKKLHLEDRIVGVNGKKFKDPEVFYTGYYGPRMELGKAIEESEGDTKLAGKLTFMVVRDGKSMDVVIQLRHLGYFSRNFPFDCKKSEALVKDGCEFLLKHWGSGSQPGGSFPGHWHTQVACILALMAQGDTFMPLLKEHYKIQVEKKIAPGPGWNWCNALRLIELNEWHLLTKDKTVIPLIKQEEKILCEMQAPNGGFQHGPYKEGAYGCMALPAGLAGIGWALMKQGGIEVDKEHYLRSRNGLTWSSQPSGEIGYGVGMYTPSIPTVPPGYKPPAKFNIEDGRKTDSRGGGASSAATIMHYLDPMDPGSETYFKRGIVHMAACTDMMMDGHASAALQAQWGWIAVGLGTVTGDMKSYREMMDYWKYWFNVNRCYDGSFYFSPCIDSQVDPFSDIRYISTGSAILALSIPKHGLAIMGRDPLIPGVEKAALSPTALKTYNAVRTGKGKTPVILQSISSLKKSAKGDESTALDLMEQYVMKPVLDGIGDLESLVEKKDMYKLSEKMVAADLKYKGVGEYDTRTVPLRAVLTANQGQQLMAVGKNFYMRVAPLYEGQLSGSLKKGQVLKATKEFISSSPPEPYLGMANDRAAVLLAELEGVVSEVTDLQKEGDVYKSAVQLVNADKEYGAYSNYVAMVASFHEMLKTPENVKLMQIGGAYYKIIEPVRSSVAVSPTRGQTIQSLKGFIGVNGESAVYGAKARQYREELLTELDTLVSDITALQTDGDVFQASRKLLDVDKEYAGCPEYAGKSREVRAELNKPAAKALIRIGALYYTLEDFVARNPGDSAQKRIDIFVKVNENNYYGAKAKVLVAGEETVESKKKGN